MSYSDVSEDDMRSNRRGKHQPLPKKEWLISSSIQMLALATSSAPLAGFAFSLINSIDPANHWLMLSLSLCASFFMLVVIITTIILAGIQTHVTYHMLTPSSIALAERFNGSVIMVHVIFAMGFISLSASLFIMILNNLNSEVYRTVIITISAAVLFTGATVGLSSKVFSEYTTDY